MEVLEGVGVAELVEVEVKVRVTEEEMEVGEGVALELVEGVELWEERVVEVEGVFEISSKPEEVAEAEGTRWGEVEEGEGVVEGRTKIKGLSGTGSPFT